MEQALTDLVQWLQTADVSGYTFAWIMWLVMFVVIEGAALVNKQAGDTLSEHTWKWFSIKDKGKGWRARRFSLLAFMCWLLLHFLTGGWV